MTEFKTTSYGILATCRYLPRLRLDRNAVFEQHKWMAPGLKSSAKGLRTLASWDEDSITMAVEAARGLQHAIKDDDLKSLTLASTTLPFAERLNSGVVASALGLPPSLLVRDVASSLRAATTELIDLLTRTGPTNQMLLASDRRIPKPASAQEMLYGDGAAGVIVGEGKPIATLVASRSVHADLVHRFRSNNQAYEYGWEERWVRDEGYMKIVVPAIQECLSQANIYASDIAHFVLPNLLNRIDEAVAKKLRLAAEALVNNESDQCGDLGVAQPLALLDIALRRAKAGDYVLLVNFASGCDVLLMQRTAQECAPERPLETQTETSYLKYLSFTGQLDLEWGMRAEMDNKTALSAAWREGGKISHFEAGACSCCGTVQFPMSHVCVNPACRQQDTQTPKSLADTPAKVLTHTSDWLGYTPSPPFQFGHIDFEGGGRVLMEFADTDPHELQVGLPLRMVFRVKEYDSKRGYRRYFWKATPVRGNDQGVTRG